MNSFAKEKFRVLIYNWMGEYDLNTKEAINIMLSEIVNMNLNEENNVALPKMSKYNKTILTSKDKTNVISIKINDELLYVANDIDRYIQGDRR